MSHPLLPVLLDAADGVFPEADGTVEILPPLPGGLECSLALTGRAYVATALPDAEVAALAPDGFGGSMAPDFLRGLAGPGGEIGVLDAVLVARGTGGGTLPARGDLAGHPRVRHALGLRAGVRVHGDERGLVTLAAGLAGRLELSIETAATGRGDGPSLLADALALVPAGEPVFAAVSPGNARSLRAFLRLGFTPVGGEVIIRPGGRRGPAGNGAAPCSG
ncbi:N-acetyltransferase [Actinorhabdospora filicis]|uniref:N-acetyltransferase n=1 Tax=Actinorhabdospora filicis TaxID=1785913 RepID=A0A9W6STB1_9ACTN|nr:hypothetical protein [Actinorhabdospora filicis]GLZ81579.1 N-acetyltransferase [Actinorhabdospora filicis]